MKDAGDRVYVVLRDCGSDCWWRCVLTGTEVVEPATADCDVKLSCMAHQSWSVFQAPLS